MKKSILFAFILSILFGATSCVHEWPELPEGRKVTLTITHQDPQWNYIFQDITRNHSTIPAGIGLRYILQVYPKGDVSHLVGTYTFYTGIPALVDYTCELTLPAGEYDIYIWNDYVNSGNHKPAFYNAADFARITYEEPYFGNSELKDCFKGKVTVDIPVTLQQDVDLNYSVEVKRPLTAYAFIAADLRQFVQDEITRRQLPGGEVNPDGTEAEDPSEVISRIPDFTGYRVQFNYTRYLPTVFNIFRDAPTSSALGISYSGKIVALNSDEALLGFDYFFINGDSSTITVSFIVYDPEGNQVASAGPFDIHVEKNHCTVVTGDFLTSVQKPGLGIDPGFIDSYNIVI